MAEEKDFFFILNAVKILDVHDIFKGEVRLISIASTDLVPTENEKLIRVETQLFHNVKSGGFLALGTTGKLLYHSPQRPKFLNWSLLIIEDDEDVRHTGAVIKEIVDGGEFQGVEDALRVLLKANPTALAAEVIVKQAAKMIANVLIKNKNDQIGLIETTFIHKIHNIDDLQISGEPCGDARLAYKMCYV